MTPQPFAADSHPQSFVVRPQDYPRPLNVVGEHITVLASGEATAGYEIFLHEDPEGSGPPPHQHPWDESFYVIRGELEFGLDEEKFVAGPGTLVHVPAGTTHWFRCTKGGAETISMTARLGASRMYSDLDREIAPERPDLKKVIEVGARHGLTVAV